MGKDPIDRMSRHPLVRYLTEDIFRKSNYERNFANRGYSGRWIKPSSAAWVPKIPDENSQYPPNYWSFFSIVLKLFKFWGVLPVNIKFCRNRSPPVLIKFSVFGFISASFFFGFTLVHAIWGPAMMMNFEKSVLGDSFNSSNSTTKEHKKLGSSDGKISTISKSVYPIMGSSTPLTARFVSMFLLSKSISVLVRSFCLADNFLCLPSPYHLSNFGALLVLTGAGIAVHVPIIGLHFREVAPLNTYLGIIWEENTKIRTNLYSVALPMQHHSYGPTNKTMTVEKQHKLRISSHREIDTTEALKSLRRGHIALYDTMEHINAIYQIHLLASITTSVIKILFNSYNILFVFASSQDVCPPLVDEQFPILGLWTFQPKHVAHFNGELLFFQKKVPPIFCVFFTTLIQQNRKAAIEKES
ncbi:hypothetical protein RUM44_002330 [Polyplax serrata]|uniref:Odorant receptor n=1 Tax=Polyplax serrata TaxID=468196 RepID=A0ABR1APB7_POLSC